MDGAGSGFELFVAFFLLFVYVIRLDLSFLVFAESENRLTLTRLTITNKIVTNKDVRSFFINVCFLQADELTFYMVFNICA